MRRRGAKPSSSDAPLHETNGAIVAGTIAVIMQTVVYTLVTLQAYYSSFATVLVLQAHFFVYKICMH
jgi:hypothetical protein